MSEKKECFSMVKEAFSSEDLSFRRRALYFLLGVTIEPIADLGRALNKMGIETGESPDGTDFNHYD